MKINRPLFPAVLCTALALMTPVGAAEAAALQLNGVNQSVQIADSPSVSPTGPITVEAWINRAASGLQHSIVEKFGCTVGDGGYVLRVTAGDRLLFGTRDDCNNGSSVIGNIPIPANVWTHVAGSWDGARLRLFVNGVADTTATTTRNPKNGTSPLRIGERGNGGTPFNGQIDEVRLWNVARTVAQIATNRTVCLVGNEAGLAGYWRLDEGAGVTTADATGNGNTGTLVNGASWAAVSAFVCAAPPPPPPAPPVFDALEIFPVAVPTALLVVPPTFPGAVSDTTPLSTNGFVGSLPTGAVAHVVMPGATIVAINTDAGTGSREFLIDAGAGNLHFVYADVNTAIDPVVVGSIVKVVANRTQAPGPIVAESIRLKTVAGLGFDISLLLMDGIVSQASAVKWTIGGVPFNIVPATGALPTAIDPLLLPVVPGVTAAAVLFTPAAGAIVRTLAPGESVFDALEIFTPVAAVLTVPAPLFRGAVADATPMPSPNLLPPGTILDVVIPGGSVTRINGSLATGQELIVDTGGGNIVRVYTHTGTVFRDPVGAGSIVKIVGSRTLLPGPIVADDIRTRPVAGGGIAFTFEYQGLITRADPAIWTVGGVDFNIIPPTGAVPTSIALTTPLVLGITPATVLFSVVPGVVLEPPTLTVAATDAAAAEAGLDPAVFTFTRTGLIVIPLNITYTLTGTALNGTDYVLTPNSVLMPIGATNATVTITPIDDTIFDPNEAVILTITASPTYIVGASNSATAIITDNEVGPPTVTVVATDAAAAETLSDPAVFTISRSGPTTVPVTINYTLTGTALNGTDYTLVPLSAVIPIGSSSATVTITPIDDAVFDPNETVILTITANAAYILGAPVSATAIITDNEVGPPTVTVVATDPAAAETLSDPAVFTISRSGPTTVPVTINYTLTGTALNGTDYTLVPLSVVIPIGASNATITITPIDDAVFDPNETVILTITANAAYILGTPSAATAIITDNEVGPPTVTVVATDAAAAETLSDPAVFTLLRSGPTTAPVTVNYTLTGTALNGTDYTLVPLSVVIPIGAASSTVTITPIDDAILDPNETVILTIAANAAYVVGTPNSATAIITDNEVAPPTVTVVATDAAAAEALSNPAVFTVSRTGPTTGPLTVNYTLTGTALNGTDYILAPLSVAIPVGASSTTVTITPIDDAIFDPNETVILTISANAAYLVGAANRATATIADNDVAPPPPVNALAFNGVNQSVQVTDNASVSITGAITIEAWIRRSVTGVQHSIVEKYGCNAGEGGYVLRVTASDNLMFGTRDDCNNGTSVTGNSIIPANTWTHVAGHWDGSVMRVFVNGVQDSPGVLSARNPKDGPTPLKIGERGNGGTPFNGQIDEVRLWSTTRSAAQINANKGVCIPALTPNLIGYWKLDEAAGVLAADSSGNGNNGALINAPTHVTTVAPVTCP